MVRSHQKRYERQARLVYFLRLCGGASRAAGARFGHLKGPMENID